MFSRELLIELYRHMEWADSRVWAMVPRQGGPDPRLHDVLVHLHMVQHAFLAAWRGDDIRRIYRTPADFSTTQAVCDWARGYYPHAHDFLGTITDDRSSQSLTLPWAGRLTAGSGQPPGQTTLGETCFQVVSHSTYHRGQANARLRELGVEPPLVDYIAWLWFGRPDPVWTP